MLGQQQLAAINPLASLYKIVKLPAAAPQKPPFLKANDKTTCIQLLNKCADNIDAIIQDNTIAYYDSQPTVTTDSLKKLLDPTTAAYQAYFDINYLKTIINISWLSSVKSILIQIDEPVSGIHSAAWAAWLNAAVAWHNDIIRFNKDCYQLSLNYLDTALAFQLAANLNTALAAEKSTLFNGAAALRDAAQQLASAPTSK